MENTSDNDDTITKPKMKKERKPMSEETLKKLADARAVVAANRAAKKRELEEAKAIVKANKEKASKAIVEEPVPVKKPAKKAPVIVQEDDGIPAMYLSITSLTGFCGFISVFGVSLIFVIGIL